MTTATMSADEQAMLRLSLRHAVDTAAARDVPDALLAAGWSDLVDAVPAMAITLLCEEAGRARSAAPVTDLAILWGAGIPATATTAVVLDGLALSGTERADRFVGLQGARLVTVDAAAVTRSGAGGFDPALGLSTITIPDEQADEFGDEARATSARAAGRRALASQMVGAVDQMLADTLDYVNERHQYGRAIGSFQTVKHRLAEVKVAVTAARAGVRAAWEYADTPDAPIAAMAAKVLAGRAQQLASTQCFQVHGGIAFTVEHGFQQWVRRGLLLDLLLGGHEQLTAELGRRLIQDRRVVRLPDLYPPHP